MKVKNVEKKLKLKKQTVSDLDAIAMDYVKGGNYYESWVDQDLCVVKYSLSTCNPGECPTGYAWCI